MREHKHTLKSFVIPEYFLSICPQITELRSRPVYCSLACSLYGLVGALTIYNIKTQLDTVLWSFKPGLFRSCTSDGFIYHWLGLSLMEERADADSREAVWKRLTREVKPGATCDFHAVLHRAWKFGACHQRYSWKLACHGKEPFMRIWSRLGRESGYILCPLLCLYRSVFLSVCFSISLVLHFWVFEDYSYSRENWGNCFS